MKDTVETEVTKDTVETEVTAVEVEKVSATLPKDEAIRSLFLSFLQAEDDEHLVNFGTFSDAVIKSSQDPEFKKHAREAIAKDPLTKEDIKQLFREILSYK